MKGPDGLILYLFFFFFVVFFGGGGIIFGKIFCGFIVETFSENVS